ncbi:MAG TPA: FmdB family zinc ribbon protein [Verrucomicrobiae bacterium]|nr:FmdB family zinc ribbon protein [Verrucomicrobiae bacterium]
MPTYEYECNTCRYAFEAFQGISESPLAECPRCKGPVKRKISGGAGLLFKGKGFYITDYRSENYKKKAAEEKPKSENSKEKKEANKPKSETAKPPKPPAE